MPKFTIPDDFTDRQRREKLMDKLIAEKLVEISTFAENAKCHRQYHFNTRLAHAPGNIRRPRAPAKPRWSSGFQLYTEEKGKRLRRNNPDLCEYDISVILRWKWKQLSDTKKEIFNGKVRMDALKARKDELRYTHQIRSTIRKVERTRLQSLRSQLHILKTKRAAILEKDYDAAPARPCSLPTPTKVCSCCGSRLGEIV